MLKLNPHKVESTGCAGLSCVHPCLENPTLLTRNRKIAEYLTGPCLVDGYNV